MAETGNSREKVSVIIPVGARQDDLGELISDYARELEASGQEFEIIAVVDGPRRAAVDVLAEMAVKNSWLRVVELSREFGESAALTAGFSIGTGDMYITLPAYYQVEPAELPKLIQEAGDHDDMLIAVHALSCRMTVVTDNTAEFRRVKGLRVANWRR